jgi:hypothetical protein
MQFYSDREVIAFARRHHLALLMPHQCPARNAPGELSSAKLILLGFSGTGALFAHFVGYASDRVVGSILTDPGHYDPVGVDNVRLPPAALAVPELIMVGGADEVSGTERPYNYSVYTGIVALHGHS